MGNNQINISKYTDVGLFIDKQSAIDFRNKNYKLCSYHLIQDQDKIRLYVKQTGVISHTI